MEALLYAGLIMLAIIAVGGIVALLWLRGLDRELRNMEEVSTSEDLEKEFQEFCKDYPFPWSSAYINAEYIEELCKGVAKHFYELGKGSQPQLPSNVEEAADAYDRTQPYKVIPAEAFKAGAEWAMGQFELVYEGNGAVPGEGGGYWPIDVKLYLKKEDKK